MGQTSFHLEAAQVMYGVTMQEPGVSAVALCALIFR
jgi:hypothetical protein